MPYLLIHYVHLMLQDAIITVHHAFIVIMQDASGNPLEWASQHLHVIGWPVLVLLAWKARGILQDATDGKDMLTKMATNDIPHIQAAMQDILTEIKGLREDLRRRD